MRYFTIEEAEGLIPQIEKIFAVILELGAKASAKISTRLVHDQNPERVFAALERYVTDLVGDMGRVQFRRFGCGLPFRVDASSPAVQAGLRALESGFKKPATTFGMGGSIPIVAPLVSVTGAPCVLMGFGLPEDNLHAPNENFPIACYLNGARAAAAFLGEMGTLKGC